MKEFKDWRDKHYKVICDFVQFINQKSHDYILKGGTSLLRCYKLDRFSEDIDLDGTHNKNFQKIVDEFCRKNHYTYRVAKDTDIVKRYMINYDGNERPLKVEISYRRKEISEDEITEIDGITVYKINVICIMKANAYSSRDKIRDLYDICFICNNYWDVLSEDVKKMIRSAVEYKGIEQFEYITKDQKDELIDNKKLEEDFLKMYEKLNLLAETDENDEEER